MWQEIRSEQRDGHVGHQMAPSVPTVTNADVKVLVTVYRNRCTVGCGEPDAGWGWWGFLQSRAGRRRLPAPVSTRNRINVVGLCKRKVVMPPGAAGIDDGRLTHFLAMGNLVCNF